ncbi:MAG TPA: hypothetical protein VIM10_03120 [Actinopolymorphaceae bacterium]
MGWLVIAHLVLMFASFSLQRVSPLGAKPATVIADHVTWSMTKGFTGGYLTSLSFLVFLLAATLLARLLRGDTEIAGWLSSTIAASGSIYVAVTFSSLSNLGAALYDGHTGAPLSTVTALDHVHWFGVFLATEVLGVFILAVAAAVRATGLLPRWVAYSGFLVGAVCIAAVAGAGSGLVDAATVVWVLWLAGLAIAAFRVSRVSMSPTSRATA